MVGFSPSLMLARAPHMSYKYFSLWSVFSPNHRMLYMFHVVGN
jgi:hypothetical protein